MSIVLSYGYTDTAIDDVSVLTSPRGLLNFKEDFRYKSGQMGKEVVLTNLTSPTDQPEKIRICCSEVSNIFAGTGVEPTIYTPSKKGVSILAQVTDVIKVTDSADATYREYLPVSYHLVIKVPVSANIDAAQVQTGVGRLLSCLYDTGSTETARLAALIRGSLLPSDM